jgi:hypothetical protein
MHHGASPAECWCVTSVHTQIEQAPCYKCISTAASVERRARQAQSRPVNVKEFGVFAVATGGCGGVRTGKAAGRARFGRLLPFSIECSRSLSSRLYQVPNEVSVSPFFLPINLLSYSGVSVFELPPLYTLCVRYKATPPHSHRKFITAAVSTAPPTLRDNHVNRPRT